MNFPQSSPALRRRAGLRPPVAARQRSPLLALATALAATLLALAVAALSAALPFGSPGADRSSAVSQAKDAYGRLPLAFEPNRGQFPAAVKYAARGSGYAIGLTDHGALLSLRSGHKQSHTVGIDFVGGAASLKLSGGRRLPGEANYLAGDRADWRTHVPTFGQVVAHRVWPGIDTVFYGRQGQLEYDFKLAAGADPSRIRLHLSGAHPRIGRDGALLLRVAGGVLRQPRPLAYQRLGGERQPVAVRYRLSHGQVSLALGRYDPRLPLLIDPALAYSTYLGGANGELGSGIAVDSAGAAYVTGYTESADFPTTAGAVDTSFNGGSDGFVSKLNPAGSGLAYSTYLGGAHGLGIAVDSAGAAYVTGDTGSEDFPTTAGAFDTSFNGGSDGFVSKLNPAGSGLAYSTFVGGSGGERGLGIAVDSAGAAYVTGDTDSEDLPTTAGAFDSSLDGSNDAFVSKLNPAGSGLAYSTYLGGTAFSAFFGNEGGFGIAVDSAGAAYVTGDTDSADFPTTAGAFDTSYNGSIDPFVSKLNPAGSGLAYSTFVGGSGGDHGSGIAVDSAGAAYVTGSTGSEDFPTTAGAFDSSLDGVFDAFATKLNPAGSGLAYSTYLGGASGELGSGIAVDSAGAAYVTGQTGSEDFPTTAGAFDSSLDGSNDAFVSKLDPDGSGLGDSTYLGGADPDVNPPFDHGSDIAVDSAGAAYVTGTTGSEDFPTTAGAFDTSLNGSNDAFVSKLEGAPAQPAPNISDLNPDNGPEAGGNNVVITGTNLTGARDVDFGPDPATSFTVDTDTQITATAPAGTGTVDVSVTTPSGTSPNEADDDYTYNPPPPDGVGTASARGTDPDAVASVPGLGTFPVSAQYSAITNCDENANTRPFIARVQQPLNVTITRTSTQTSTCHSEGGTSVNEGTGTGTVTGDLSGTATFSWRFEESPDNVEISGTTNTGASLTISGAPQPLNGSPGGVWVFGSLPWPSAT